MKIALWIVQGLLAAAFLAGGAGKALTPLAELAAQMPWVAETPAWMTRLAGFSEIAGALGLILPSGLRIKPILTPIAALGLALIMFLAVGIHAPRGEYGMLVTNLVLAALLLFIAWGRLKKAPIAPR